MRVDPTDIEVGQSVTMSGTKCPHTDKVITSLAGTTIPDANGNWTVTARVADSTPLGEQSAMAFCGSQSNSALVFNYLYVTVRATSFRAVHVTPATVRHGGTVTITPNAPCPDSDAITRVVVTLQAADAGEYGEPITPNDYATFSPDSSGNWSGTFHVTPDTPPGSYALNASCTESRSTSAWYTLAPITVT